MKKNFSTLLVFFMMILLCSCNDLPSTKSKTINNNTESIYVVVENLDNETKGIIYAHEKDNFYHKLNLDFSNKIVDGIKIGDTLKISYSEIVKENPATYIVETFEINNKE